MQQPETSTLAYRSLSAEEKESLKKRIEQTLSIIGFGTSEMIAEVMGLEHSTVWRRCSDLLKDKRIVETEYARKNKSGRLATLYSLPNVTIRLTPIWDNKLFA